MKMRAKITTAMLAGLLAVSQSLASAQEASQQASQPAAQQTTSATEQSSTSNNSSRSRRSTRTQKPQVSVPERQSSSTGAPSDAPANAQEHRNEQSSEDEAAIAASYNNFFEHYRLGPEDVVSITVFGQDRYSKQGITIPPNGRLYHPLIPEGIFVSGKTVEEVTQELKKRLDEYIIDPQVAVSLDRAVSYRYSVLGEVAQPGVKPMNRRLTVYEALGEAGGVLDTGNKKKVFVIRRQADGRLSPTLIDVAAIERGRAPDNFYLAPGDQVIVTGNRKKAIDGWLKMLPILSFARIFVTGGF